ncbi:hypothetical protein K1T71_015015 [Dendrolimus kikuchii]|nr:hypothetical protein K1T71_015015 [Dendrolimus kikuchii]
MSRPTINSLHLYLSGIPSAPNGHSHLRAPWRVGSHKDEVHKIKQWIVQRFINPYPKGNLRGNTGGKSIRPSLLLLRLPQRRSRERDLWNPFREPKAPQRRAQASYS